MCILWKLCLWFNVPEILSQYAKAIWKYSLMSASLSNLLTRYARANLSCWWQYNTFTISMLRMDSQTQREMLNGDVLISIHRWTAGSRCVTGVMILWRVKSRSDRWYLYRSRRLWMGTDAGFSGLEQEDDVERRWMEDEEHTLRMTQEVSIFT